MVVEHRIHVGRRSAAVRMVHFLLDLGSRLELVDLATRRGNACPLSQCLLADAPGLTAVHVNRVLRHLREDGFVTVKRGRVILDDYDGLAELAGLDRSYLDHEGPLLSWSSGQSKAGIARKDRRVQTSALVAASSDVRHAASSFSACAVSAA